MSFCYLVRDKEALINSKKHLFFPSTFNLYVKPTVSLATRLETERKKLVQRFKKTFPTFSARSLIQSQQHALSRAEEL